MKNTKIQENIKNTEIQENKKKVQPPKKSRISQKKINEAYNKLTEYNKKQIDILNKMTMTKFNKNITDINIHELIHYITTAQKENNENYSESWKKKMMFSLKAYYTLLKKPVKLIDKNADKLFKEIKNEEIKQKQTNKEIENYLTYDELQILLNENKNYKTKRQMNRYLILASIATDQPPLRPQIYSNLHIVTNKKDIKNDDNNYMYVNKQQKKGYLFINNDKVDKFNTKNKQIDLKPIFLNIIIESLKKYPRTEFLEYKDVKSIEKKLLDELQLITNNNFTFHMARSSFINNWLKQNPNATDAQKIQLSKDMRHSFEIQTTYYKKIEPISGNLEKIKAKLQEKQEKKQIKKNDENTEPKKYEKYKEVNKIRALIAKANRLNHKIKEDTLERYGILQHENGKYYLPKQKKEQVKKQIRKIITEKPNLRENNNYAQIKNTV